LLLCATATPGTTVILSRRKKRVKGNGARLPLLGRVRAFSYGLLRPFSRLWR
jgi:hypothetical protein